MTKRFFSFCICFLAFMGLRAEKVYDAATYGIHPNTGADVAGLVEQMLATVKSEAAGKAVTVRFAPGRYDFYPESAVHREYYISNHDQHKDRAVGIAIEGFDGLTLDGCGADFIFHGRMLPVSVVGTNKCTLRNFSIDFATPHIAQAEVIKNDAEAGITFRIAPWVNARVTENGSFEHYGEGWAHRPGWGIPFDPATRRILYKTGDIGTPVNQVQQIDERTFLAPGWKDSRLPVGAIVAMRSYERPSPGVFVTHATDTRFVNVKVHYAEGMGLLAQMSENITLDGFCVSLRGDDDPRYFTTQADATHFSGCKGKITSVNGLYEGMMDDAINVHGTYLKVIERVDDHTLKGRYMHGQAWGFDWGYVGDEVQFVRSNTMELVGGSAKPFVTTVAEISVLDALSGVQTNANNQKQTAKSRDEIAQGLHGGREFLIRFADALPAEIGANEGFGIENLTWTPEVYFADNTIRNNRARGTLFSTPKRTVVEDNLFDHTSGTAILLCGDCNGWYETGACRDVLIRRNRFINSLTCMFQFTNAVISIYPEIPNLNAQKEYFHGGKKNAIRIVNNEFESFDHPLLYAKSINGLLWKGNTIRHNEDYAPFHWNNSSVLLERAINVKIDNTFYDQGNELKQVKMMLK
ncbi:MAG: right-handed parallel beta-helix repeat-containing protein [Bacteroidaceae bacterium]|nr:right-handed parallel beta-helix repeat-containing protein [Bacteroidaceae bacterium]